MESDSLVLENGLLREALNLLLNAPEPDLFGSAEARRTHETAHRRARELVDQANAVQRATRTAEVDLEDVCCAAAFDLGREVVGPLEDESDAYANFACGFAFDVGRERENWRARMVDLQNEVAHLRGEGYRPEGGARPFVARLGRFSRIETSVQALGRSTHVDFVSPVVAFSPSGRAVALGDARWLHYWRAAAESHRQLCALFDAVRVFPAVFATHDLGAVKGWTGELRDALDVVAAHLNSVNPEALDAEAALATISPDSQKH